MPIRFTFWSSSTRPSSSSSYHAFRLFRVRVRIHLLSPVLALLVMKIVQYLFKVVLWADLVSKTTHPTAHARISAVVSQFSMTRRILRLGHVNEPYAELRDLIVHEGGLRGTVLKPGLSVKERFVQVLAWYNPAAGIVNDVVDDTICLAKMGAIDKSWAKRLDMTSTRLWFSTILVDLYDNYRGQQKLTADVARKRRDLATLNAQALAYPSPASSPIMTPSSSSSASPSPIQEQIRTARTALQAAEFKLWMQRVSFAKLMADFAFCWVDFRQLSGHRADGVQAVAGFCAALLGTYKIWVKCR
ncbi:hypothetical protein BCR44DRAFT_341146 [Catenaria anguillulae PL171]|uniref:Uncharacterized protein n=1 Tax=Catenaria anguillulae PL171 TaxID=765915 RepID=A0A1Y2I480_9FUNG|nr:hypothetical protein BCR44DRAFT_341146 [Catenaria anguillulae PL171]